MLNRLDECRLAITAISVEKDHQTLVRPCDERHSDRPLKEVGDAVLITDEVINECSPLCLVRFWVVGHWYEVGEA